ncbi:TetR family transcriptional regulator [Nonomuraea lactucae]|uniref:TetR family transcriptional regulator n=1 Tax=Nonomuraea lactucae TaxID=2249762 RepID=UPI001964B747|nr:TetR family transcriptional regulator [Nonomuraea lactucae]
MILIRRDLAERKRQLVRDELSHTAAQLIARNGFEETTVDQIVEAAGVSRRTFFRYFKSKEDVIVEVVSVVGEHACAELAARPPAEPPATAVRHALGALVGHYRDHQEKSLALSRLILGIPALRARYLDRQHEWRRAFAAELARRADERANDAGQEDAAPQGGRGGVVWEAGRGGHGAPPDMRHALTAAVAFAALDVAVTTWVESGGAEDLHALLDTALTRVGLDTLA